ncbi:MAG: anhydro-N-acetylmuramic acid kinase [Bacteroidetes bacterium]|nr:anhydro-N-acetylmuramic acid kinase [Bacteroidota bacterium]MBU1117289.1 anhydro-N-acetylmuramic acid kinase [Bacteroidota bacterium]MBU1797371.1 anhydro-N-acetylmuramic acid kinase [Bacteroidota bacterium]
MKKLLELANKEVKYVIGLMSGTSLDGVDVALVEISNNWIDTRINLLGFIEYPLPDGLKALILKNSARETSNVEDISQLNFLIPQIYVEAIDTLCKEINFDKDKIDLIGSHGQTIHHLPNSTEYLGYKVSSSLQIGDPSVLAKLTGKITVGDFRPSDVALGGQGAPLVPYFDFLLFHSNEKNRGLLNIGGISNITILHKEMGQNNVLAFDAGPGNMMIDILMKRFYDKEFDENGDIANSGKLNEDLLIALITKDNFIESEPPKSTGREYYGMEFLVSFFDEFKDVPSEDWLHTITKFTAYSVYRNYEKFVEKETKLDELFISGGGAKNKFLYQSLAQYFENVEVKVIDEIGVSSDAKEAICFAVLANETISGNPSNIPRTTGASKSTILGKICLP